MDRRDARQAIRAAVDAAGGLTRAAEAVGFSNHTMLSLVLGDDTGARTIAPHRAVALWRHCGEAEDLREWLEALCQPEALLVYDAARHGVGT